MKPIIETKQLCFTYSTGTPFEKAAVTDCNIKINKGEFLGIIGHTGSGKSTLVQMLNGLIKPTSGHVLIDGTDIWVQPKKIRDVRFKVGLVFQYPEHQLFAETVEKDIAFGPGNQKLTEDEIKQRVEEAAEFAGLQQSLLLKSPFDLSGGEKRRAAIAGVIAMRPEILILDEPTAGLDPQGRDAILKQVSRYRETSGSTVILVTHSMEDAARFTDRLLVMGSGRAVMLDDTAKVFEAGEELEKLGLRLPQITKIFTLLREKGYDFPTDILTVERGVEEIKMRMGS